MFHLFSMIIDNLIGQASNFRCCIGLLSPLVYLADNSRIAKMFHWTFISSVKQNISTRFAYSGFAGKYKLACSGVIWVHAQPISLVFFYNLCAIEFDMHAEGNARISNFKTQPIYFIDWWDTKLKEIHQTALGRGELTLTKGTGQESQCH